MLPATVGIIGIFLAILLSRPITTFVHELGHAIPSLLFTSNEVVIYIGSYGDTSNSSQMQLGRLTIIFKFNLTDWQLGLCRHSRATTIWQEMLIILGGPIFSLLLGLAFVALLSNFKEDQYIAFTIGIFITAGLLDFIANILPSQQPLEMHDGGFTYNDGAQFLQLLKTSNYPPSYFEGIHLLNDNKIRESVDKFKTAINNGATDLDIYQLVMHIFRENQMTEEAIPFYEAYGNLFKLSSNDFVAIGHLYENQEDHLKAITHYSKAIEENYLNKQALSYRGKLLLKLGYKEKGMADLKKAELMTTGSGLF